MTDFYVENGSALLGMQMVIWSLLSVLWVALAIKDPSALRIGLAALGCILASANTAFFVLVWRRKRASTADAARPIADRMSETDRV